VVNPSNSRYLAAVKLVKVVGKRGCVVKAGFEPGIVRSLELTVTPDMCPAFDGVVVHRVYSTWSVAHHFEIASRMVLVDFLEPHEEGVGSHVSVDHHAPCPEGNRVRIQANLVEVTRGRHIKVVCECRAFWGDRLLATGKQIQVVMEKEHLKRYLERS